MVMRDETGYKLHNAVEVIGYEWFTKDWYERQRNERSSDEFPAWETLKKYLVIEDEYREQCVDRYEVPDDLPAFLDMVNGFAGNDLWNCEFNFQYRNGGIEDIEVVRYYRIVDAHGFDK